MEGMNNSCHACKNCACVHHKMLPGAIFLIGVVFLLKALNVMDAATVDILWPILLILGTGVKLISGNCKCYKQ